MRIVEILPEIDLVELDGTPIKNEQGELVCLKHTKFLLDRLIDSVFTADLDGLARGIGIRKKILNYKNEGFIELEDSDWDKLCSACKRNYNPQIAHNLMPFIDSVLLAKRKE